MNAYHALGGTRSVRYAVAANHGAHQRHALKLKRMGMHFADTIVVGAWLISPNPLHDDRGRFMRAWCSRELEENGLEFVPVQANMGFSLHKGTIRGMHFQDAEAPEAKLVRCTRGAIFDVVVDLRVGSPSYGKWYGAELSAENGRMLYVPALCAHGYQTLEDNTEIFYMASGFYAPTAVRGVRFDDPAFSIDWPLPAIAVSGQDRNWPFVSLKGVAPRRP